MADLALTCGATVTISQPQPPVFAIEPPTSVQVVVPVRGIQGLPGEAAEGPIDPVDLYLSARAQEA